jgi:hypothetical protein
VVPRLSPAELDDILALQLTIAWAGEAAGEPVRLGWWRTDLVDLEGGRDLFARLAPRTSEWASLVLVLAAARRVDAAGRAKAANGEGLWTPFTLGFEVDQQIDERIAHHRTHEHNAAAALGPRFLVSQPWSCSGFEQLLTEGPRSKVTSTPTGRLLVSRPTTPLVALRMLAAALLPLEKEYPLPHLEMGS